MEKTISTFKRYEKKYVLDSQQYAQLYQLITEHIIKDRYDNYTICNIYYDTDNYEIIRRSLEKPVYKEKLRIRSYGTPQANDKIFFELKKKYKKEVFKRRISLSVHELDEYLKNGKKPQDSLQIMEEIEYFLSLYNPKPKVFIAYERMAFSGKDNKELRITFDKNIRFRNNELDLMAGDYGKLILAENQYLMEIKTCGPMPLWLSQTINNLSIFPTSFSKYGYCYSNYLNCIEDRRKQIMVSDHAVLLNCNQLVAVN